MMKKETTQKNHSIGIYNMEKTQGRSQVSALSNLWSAHQKKIQANQLNPTLFGMSVCTVICSL